MVKRDKAGLRSVKVNNWLKVGMLNEICCKGDERALNTNCWCFEDWHSYMEFQKLIKYVLDMFVFEEKNKERKV